MHSVNMPCLWLWPLEALWLNKSFSATRLFFLILLYCFCDTLCIEQVKGRLQAAEQEQATP